MTVTDQLAKAMASIQKERDFMAWRGVSSISRGSLGSLPSEVSRLRFTTGNGMPSG